MIAAVDIGGTKIAVGMVDSDGRVLWQVRSPTAPSNGYSNALDRIVHMLRDASASTGMGITGIGIGSTGPVCPSTGEIGNVNFFPNWRGENPVKDLERIFQVSVAMENDADAAALAEAGWGAGRNRSRLIYVTVGTGIGVGVVLDGRVYRGVDQAHPEIGHHLIDPSGPLCDCGFHGCWESLAAGPAMVTWIESNAPPDYPYRSGLTAKKICELAETGETWALQAVDREGYYLGLGLANLMTMFVPDAIVLGGSVMKSAGLFLEKARKSITSSCRLVPFEKTELALASLGEDSNLIGAARVWYQRFGTEADTRAIDFSVIEGEYLRDLLDQPRALNQTLVGLEVSKTLHQLAARLQKGSFKTVVLTGMGSSFHALHPLNVELINHGLTAMMVETSELVHYKSRLFDPNTLVVAVSQSGQSAEVIRLLEINRGKSSIIAITNTPDSPLAKRADAAILTRAGKEFSVSCKTYLTALMALTWLGDILCERDLQHTRQECKTACPAVEDYLATWKRHVQDLAQLLEGIRHLFLVGRGASLAAVGTGALIVKESDHFHGEGMSSAAFRHGPFEMLSDETFVLVFGGANKTRDLNQRLFEDVREQQGRAELVGQGATSRPFALPNAPKSIYPILEILPVQMITLALAAQSGREPGRFELATKVTTRE